jgi:Stigma-specific protein, Stig1
MRQTVVRSFLVACACLILGGACGSNGKAKTIDAAVAAPVAPKDASPDARDCVLTNVNYGSTTYYSSGATVVINCVTYTCVNGVFNLSGLPCVADASVVVVNFPDAPAAQNDAAAKDAGASDVPVTLTLDAGSDVLLAQDLVEQVDTKIAADVVPDSTSAIADATPSPDAPSISGAEVGIIHPIQDAAAEVVAILVSDAKVVVDSEPDAKVIVPDAASDISVSPDAPPCPNSNLLFCSGVCVDGRFDPLNCGSCAHLCATGEYCSAGVCQSTIGTSIVFCNGSYRDTQNDPHFCGGCNSSCRADQDCLAGVCECTNGLVDCGGACVDTQTNNANCGSCGNACPAVQSCLAGVCQCPFLRRLCGNVCVDYFHDPANCGTCGNTCAPGTTCVYDPNHPMSGISCQTVCGLGTTKCSDNQCHNTQTESANCGTCGNACRTDQSCVSGSCQCTNGLIDCGGSCVDTQTSNANCGSCENACPVAQSCVAGSCQCPAPQKWLCGSVCVNLLNDPQHCGGCEKTCATGLSCVEDITQYPYFFCRVICTGGTTACGNSCRDLMSDPNNCNACGNACPLGEYCVNGVCDVKCPTGQNDCSKVCVDESVDNQNCGGCGVSCPTGQSCSSGTCQCTGGKTKCGNNTCSDTTADPLNCGTCGNPCPTGEICQASVCTCPGSTTRCGNACVDTSTSNQNCGGCGVSCPTAQSCQSGSCGCSAAGTSYCNGSCVNYATDRNNCGSCGHSCGNYGSCQSGTCVGSYEMSTCRTTYFNHLVGFTNNDHINSPNLTVTGSAVFGSLGTTLVAPSSMLVSFHYYTTANTCNNGGLPYLEVYVGNNPYQQQLPCQSSGSSMIPATIPAGTGINDISFVIFSGDWALSVVIDSITFK